MDCQTAVKRVASTDVSLRNVLVGRAVNTISANSGTPAAVVRGGHWTVNGGKALSVSGTATLNLNNSLIAAVAC